MHLLMIILRWLAGLLPGGVRAVLAEPARASVRAICSLVRPGFLAPDFPHVGWMNVRPALEEYIGPPAWQTAGVHETCPFGGIRRLDPVQPNRFLHEMISYHYGSTDLLERAYPIWG